MLSPDFWDVVGLSTTGVVGVVGVVATGVWGAVGVVTTGAGDIVRVVTTGVCGAVGVVTTGVCGVVGLVTSVWVDCSNSPVSTDDLMEKLFLRESSAKFPVAIFWLEEFV